MNKFFANPLNYPGPLDVHTATSDEVNYAKRWARSFLWCVSFLMFGAVWIPALMLLGSLSSLWPVLVICTICALVIGEWMIQRAANRFSNTLNR
jgi:hypothetical protein